MQTFLFQKVIEIIKKGSWMLSDFGWEHSSVSWSETGTANIIWTQDRAVEMFEGFFWLSILAYVYKQGVPSLTQAIIIIIILLKIISSLYIHYYSLVHKGEGERER